MKRAAFGLGLTLAVGTVAGVLILPAEVQGAEYKLRLPLGLQEGAAYIPEENPLTAEKIALGKQFFWDKRWSSTGTVACVSCHLPEHGWGVRANSPSTSPGSLLPATLRPSSIGSSAIGSSGPASAQLSRSRRLRTPTGATR